jgi:hypothetical protein
VPHAYTHPRVESHLHLQPFVHANTYSYSDSYFNYNTDSDDDPNSYTYSDDDSNSYTYFDTETFTETENRPDAQGSSYSATAPVVRQSELRQRSSNQSMKPLSSLKGL